MTIAAAIDIGSNSVHLFVGAIGRDGVIALIDESVQMGLGDVVDREGTIPAEARDQIVDVLSRYVAKARSLGAVGVSLLATEPLRRASNRSVIQADVLRAVGEPLQILGHDAESQLTLLGVVGGRAPDSPLMVVDAGGGSTEFIVVTPGRAPVVAALDTGAARLTTQFVGHDPPTWFEINALRGEVRRRIAALPSLGGNAATGRGVAVGGSATNVGRVVSPPLPGGPLTAELFERVFSVLATRASADLAATFGVSVRRATQLAAGAALLDGVRQHFALDELEVSTASLREGAVLAAQHGPDWLQRLPEFIASRGPA